MFRKFYQTVTPHFIRVLIYNWRCFGLIRITPLTKVEVSFHFFKRKKCLFIHIPKTAGISLYQSLFQTDSFGHIPIYQYHSEIKYDEVKKLHSFCVVRDPFDRLVSSYFYLKKGGRMRSIDIEYSKTLASCESFETFVLLWLDRPEVLEMEHFKTQCHYLKNEKGNVEIDSILHMETLQKDLIKLTKLLGSKEIKLKNLNTNPKSEEIVFTADMKEIIKKVYHEDFINLGY